LKVTLQAFAVVADSKKTSLNLQNLFAQSFVLRRRRCAQGQLSTSMALVASAPKQGM